MATLDLSDSAPGLFETNFQGRNIGIAAHADGQLVTSQNPAAPGETIVIYGTGFGPVDEAQQSGEIAPARIIRTRGAAADDHCGTRRGGPVLRPDARLRGPLPSKRYPSSGTPSGEQDFVLTVNGVASNTVKIAVR
ncbi:MAG: hypothetical protein R2748_03270 [Bryobacterales bacterium]